MPDHASKRGHAFTSQIVGCTAIAIAALLVSLNDIHRPGTVRLPRMAAVQTGPDGAPLARRNAAHPCDFRGRLSDLLPNTDRPCSCAGIRNPAKDHGRGQARNMTRVAAPSDGRSVRMRSSGLATGEHISGGDHQSVFEVRLSHEVAALSVTRAYPNRVV
ncbi:hypothetical protein [Jannaschia aquimarina]|uniref:Uncharacterized protein n=1 Tax=Jannaschia aquimarina TaxID=935700 RepID=A0A0D1EBE9_9RHOB|nr:hypothetical protein [Jannaschia aquimarina]KIT15069.1 hypothetical protein jaqu_33950 [Jannaschia aquimarina]SNS63265.1 hypothetical protein SAMN05421775_101721 [Jannaschia aquimarina]